MKARGGPAVARWLAASVGAAVAAAGATSCFLFPQGDGFGGGNCTNPPPEEIDVTFGGCPEASAPPSTSTSTVDAGAPRDAAAPDARSSEPGAGPACFSTCDEACDANGGTCKGVDDSGTIAHCEIVEHCVGRKLDGLEAPRIDAPTELGVRLARMAWLEAASVRAFERLAMELRAHEAPPSLVRRAKACARDEARHARMMARLARASGARVPRVRVAPSPVRELESIAIENAIEGCVGETFGAAQAAWLARSSDAVLAPAMAAIAPDELRHAELAWDVAEWAEARLSRAARGRVAAARTGAVRDLLGATRRSSADHAMALELQGRLWAA